jgi:glycosyltransferase involved in cell wall biosynthesis
MKVLFITLADINNIQTRGIYPDLLRKFRDKGHEVTIVCPNERKSGKKTFILNHNNVKILKVWTTNFQKTNYFEKFITTIIIEYLFKNAIKKLLNYKNFDVIIYTTPPITFTNLIEYLKNNSKAKTYLLLKDIFPQNAVDLNIIKKKSLIHKYFRNKERKLYKISDFIGCMSPANVSYLLNNNIELSSDKVEINPNSIEVDILSEKLNQNLDLFTEYNIPTDRIIFLFGGNLGIPQGIEFLKKNILNCQTIKECFFLIIGNGTEYDNLRNWIQTENINNILLIKELPRLEFEEITKQVHVGLIFLNPDFTIPNFPSRLLSYMQNKLPVICATDAITDIGKIAMENNFGYWCLTTDVDSFKNFVLKLLNSALRVELGNNSYNYLKKEYDVAISYQKIFKKLA